MAKHPEFYYGYIAVSQMADQARSEQMAYEYMVSECEKEGNRSLLKALNDHPWDTDGYFTSGTFRNERSRGGRTT